MTTATLTARPAETVGVGWPTMLGRTLGAEWTKLRSTYGSLAAAVVVTVGIAALAAWAITTDARQTRRRPPGWPA